MSGSFLPILETVAFLGAIWIVSRSFKGLLLPPIIGEIVAGILLGQVLDIVSFIDTDEESLFTVLGNIGVTLIIAESGLHVDIGKMKSIGYKAIAIGLLGTACPILFGFLLFLAMGLDKYPDALAAAIIITPASVSVAIRTLIGTKTLNTSYGQGIVMAATIDDFLSLIAFIVLKKATGDDTTFSSVTVPVVLAVLFTVLGLLGGVYVIKPYVPKLLHYLEKNKRHNYAKRDEYHIYLMLGLIIFYSWIGSLVGSHLLGAFIAGFSFSNITRSMYLWRTNLKIILSWLVRLFFSATVAFIIPIDILLSWDAFGNGCLIALVCIVSKLVAGLHMGKDRFIIGWALVSRGEFSFLMADFALDNEIITKTFFAQIVWGLLLSTFFSPIILQALILKRKRKDKLESGNGNQNVFQMTLEGYHHEDLLYEVCSELHDLGFDVRNVNIVSDGDIDREILEVHPRGEDVETDLGDIKHHILEAINDATMQLTFVPMSDGDHNKLEIVIMGKNLIRIRASVNTLLTHHGIIVEFEHLGTIQDVDSWTINCRGQNVTDKTRCAIRESLRRTANSMGINASVLVRYRDGTPVNSSPATDIENPESKN